MTQDDRDIITGHAPPARETDWKRLAEESSAKHRSIAEKAMVLRDALVEFTDEDSFAPAIVAAATKALADYDNGAAPAAPAGEPYKSIAEGRVPPGWPIDHAAPAGKTRCDCGAKLTTCVDCAVADYQAQHPNCPTCCPAPAGETCPAVTLSGPCTCADARHVVAPPAGETVLAERVLAYLRHWGPTNLAQAVDHGKLEEHALAALRGEGRDA